MSMPMRAFHFSGARETTKREEPVYISTNVHTFVHGSAERMEGRFTSKQRDEGVNGIEKVA
jgi:hypothetical protein